MSTVETILDRFGGATKLAEATGWPISTIHSWKALGHIPISRWPELMQVAREQSVALTESELALIGVSAANARREKRRASA